MKYFLRSGTKTYKGVRANVIGRELERIRVSNSGRLSVDAVVKAAKKRDSPIHGVFVWDMKSAAEANWKWQARHLIREITVVYVDREEPLPAFVHVNYGGGLRYYQSTDVIEMDELQAATDELLNKLRGARAAVEYVERVALRRRAARKKGKIREVSSAIRTAQRSAATL